MDSLVLVSAVSALNSSDRVLEGDRYSRGLLECSHSERLSHDRSAVQALGLSERPYRSVNAVVDETKRQEGKGCSADHLTHSQPPPFTCRLQREAERAAPAASASLHRCRKLDTSPAVDHSTPWLMTRQ